MTGLCTLLYLSLLANNFLSCRQIVALPIAFLLEYLKLTGAAFCYSRRTDSHAMQHEKTEGLRMDIEDNLSSDLIASSYVSNELL